MRGLGNGPRFADTHLARDAHISAELEWGHRNSPPLAVPYGMRGGGGGVKDVSTYRETAMRNNRRGQIGDVYHETPKCTARLTGDLRRTLRGNPDGRRRHAYNGIARPRGLKSRRVERHLQLL